MTTTKKQQGLLLFDRSKLALFVAGNASVQSFPFTPEIVSSMEIVNKQLFESQLLHFLQTQKVPPTEFTIVVKDSLLFDKIIVGKKDNKPEEKKEQASVLPGTQLSSNAAVQPSPLQPPAPAKIPPLPSLKEKLPVNEEEPLEKKIQKFIDTVPFEDAAWKTAKNAEGTHVVAGNKEFFLTVRDILEKGGHSFDYVLPTPLLPKEFAFTDALTVANASAFIGKTDVFRQYNLLAEEIKEPEVMNVGTLQVTMDKPKDNRRLIAMVAVFILLMGVMIVLYMQMNAQNAALMKPKVASQPTAIPTFPTPSVAQLAENGIQSLTEASVSARQRILIRLSHSNQTASGAAQIIASLKRLGYTNILDQVTAISTPRAIMVITPDVSQAIRTEVFSTVQAIRPTVTMQENNSESASILITL